MADNRAVTYAGPGKVEVQDIAYPGLELTDGPGVNPANVGRKCEHGVILTDEPQNRDVSSETVQPRGQTSKGRRQQNTYTLSVV